MNSQIYILSGTPFPIGLYSPTACRGDTSFAHGIDEREKNQGGEPLSSLSQPQVEVVMGAKTVQSRRGPITVHIRKAYFGSQQLGFVEMLQNQRRQPAGHPEGKAEQEHGISEQGRIERIGTQFAEYVFTEGHHEYGARTAIFDQGHSR